MELNENVKRILYNIQLCIHCKFCASVCPTYDGWLNNAAFGRFQAIYYALRYGYGDISKVSSSIFSCTICTLCEEICRRLMAGVKARETMLLIRSELVERGAVPEKVKEFLENVYKYSNPYGISPLKRAEWTEGLTIDKYDGTKEYLYYVGCVCSYNPVGQRIARSFSKLLQEAGVSFGILGEDEKCEGNEVRMLGEEGLFHLLVEENVRKLNELGVKKILTTDPHVYNALKNEYPKHGGDYAVMHHTQFLLKLIQEGRIKLSVYDEKVTYQDPCFLGRWNNIYEEPRMLLKSIPGVKYVEMPRNRSDSYCCGGGGGNFYTGYSTEKVNSARIRVREAFETGAKILVTACPVCSIMLEDALADEGLTDKLAIKDVAELLLELLKR